VQALNKKAPAPEGGRMPGLVPHW